MSKAERKTANLIITEGEDERGLVESLLEEHELPPCDCVSAEGMSAMDAQAGAALKMPGPQILCFALVRDAEANAAAACQALRGIFKRVGWPEPSDPFLVTADSTRRCGFAVLPDGMSAGAIEDMCLQAPTIPAALTCVTELFRCLEQANCASHASPAVRRKAEVQAYLAAVASNRVYHRAGLGATKGHFDLRHPVFEKLSGFLNKLLSPVTA